MALLLLAVAAALLVPTAASASARPPVPSPVSELAGPNFVVHYTASGGSPADRLTPEGAATALANAETALAWYRSQGYPAPLDDGDGKTDIYVFAVPIASPCTPGTLDLHARRVGDEDRLAGDAGGQVEPATGIYPLAISGNTASAEVPWTTCASAIGSLALPNASTSADEQPFTVHFGVSYPVPEHHELVRPRISAKRVQRFSKLAIKVHAFEKMTVKAEVFITLPRTRGSLSSHARTAKLEAGQTKTLHFKYPKASLKKIKAALAKRRLTARIRVTSHNAQGEAETQATTVKLKR